MCPECIASVLMVAGATSIGCAAAFAAKRLRSTYDAADLEAATQSKGEQDGCMLLGLVLLGKTWYPRWTALANPAVLMLLSPLADRTPAPFGAVLSGGFTNLSIAVFFLVSLCTTWMQPKESAQNVASL
jgi:hypothetical protein